MSRGRAPLWLLLLLASLPPPEEPRRPDPEPDPEPEPEPAKRNAAHGSSSATRPCDASDELPPADGIDAYHAHLDACYQCRAHPFAQCPIGDELLRRAVDP